MRPPEKQNNTKKNQTPTPLFICAALSSASIKMLHYSFFPHRHPKTILELHGHLLPGNSIGKVHPPVLQQLFPISLSQPKLPDKPSMRHKEAKPDNYPGKCWKDLGPEAEMLFVEDEGAIPAPHEPGRAGEWPPLAWDWALEEITSSSCLCFSPGGFFLGARTKACRYRRRELCHLSLCSLLEKFIPAGTTPARAEPQLGQ